MTMQFIALQGSATEGEKSETDLTSADPKQRYYSTSSVAIWPTQAEIIMYGVSPGSLAATESSAPSDLLAYLTMTRNNAMRRTHQTRKKSNSLNAPLGMIKPRIAKTTPAPTPAPPMTGPAGKAAWTLRIGLLDVPVSPPMVLVMLDTE